MLTLPRGSGIHAKTDAKLLAQAAQAWDVIWDAYLGRFKRFFSFDRWKNRLKRPKYTQDAKAHNDNEVSHLYFFILDHSVSSNLRNQINSHTKSYKSVASQAWAACDSRRNNEAQNVDHVTKQSVKSKRAAPSQFQNRPMWQFARFRSWIATQQLFRSQVNLHKMHTKPKT